MIKPRAIGQYIIVKEDPEEVKETKGGLLLNEKSRDDIRYRTGTVVSLGELSDALNEGERIMFDRAAGHKTDILDDEMKVITIRDVVAVL